MSKEQQTGLWLLVLVVVLIFVSGGKLDTVVTPPTTKVTAVVYTYEKDQTGLPPAISAAINALNRRGILATHDEVDTKDGDSQVPDQYKVSRPAAVAAGLPSLVLMAGDQVLKVVKNPKPEDVEAVK